MSDDFNNLPPWLRGNEPDDEPEEETSDYDWDAPPPPTPEELAAKEVEQAEDMLGDAFASVFNDEPDETPASDDPLASLGDDDAWTQDQPDAEPEAEAQDALASWRIESDAVEADEDADSVWGAAPEAVIEGGAEYSDDVPIADDEDAWDGGAAEEAAYDADPYADFAPVDIPPWLRGAEEELPGQQASLTTDDGVLSDAWLAQGDTLSDSYEAELTYDEWMKQQDAATRERTLEEEVPDFISGGLDESGLPGTSPFAAGGTGELPDWYLGLEQIDTQEAPEWMAGGTGADVEEFLRGPGPQTSMLMAAAAQADEAPDIDSFFSDMGMPAAPSPSAGASDVDDFFASMGMAPPSQDEQMKAETPNVDDFFADLAVPPSVSGPDNVDDFFAHMDTGMLTPPEAQAPSQTGELPDFGDLFAPDLTAAPADDEIDDFISNLHLSSVTGSSASRRESESDSAAIDADDAWARAVASIGDAEPAAADDWITSLSGQGYETAAEPLPDDFLSSLGIEPQPQAPAAEPLPDDFLDGLVASEVEEPAYDEAAINDEWQILQGLVQEDMASFGAENEPEAEPLPADFLSDLGISEPVIEEAPAARPATGSLEDFGSLFDESFAAEAEAQANELDFLGELDFSAENQQQDEWPSTASSGPLEEYVIEFPEEPAAEMEFDFDAMMSEVGGVASQPQEQDIAEPSLDDLFGGLAQEQEPAIARADDDIFSFLVEEQSAEEAAEASAADPMKQAEMEAFLDSLGLSQEESRPRPVADMTEGIASSGAQPADEDLLREFGFLLDDESQVEAPAAEADIFETAFDPDFLSQMSAAERAQSVTEPQWDEPGESSALDWFSEMESAPTSADISASELRGAPPADASMLNWLAEMGDISEADVEAMPAPTESFAPRRPLPRSEVEAQSADELQFDDLDTFLASLDDSQLALPDTGNLISPGEADLDALLSDPAFVDMDLDRTQVNEAAPEGIERASADFLAGLGAAVGTSASAILRQQDDRPLEELPERLRKLHDRSEKLPAAASAAPADTGALNQLLPGMTDSLPVSTMKAGLPALTSALALSDDQRGKVDLLKQLVAFETQAMSQAAAASPLTPAVRGPSAIDLTYEGPYSRIDDEDEASTHEESRAEKVVQETAPVARKRQGQAARLVVSLLLLLAVIAPFYFSPLRVGALPPGRFAVGSDSQRAFSRIDSLQPRDYVLVGVEYNPTAAGELDGMTEAILRHILLRRARPVLVSRSPMGLLHAGNILDAINNDPAFLRQLGQPSGLVANRDFFVLRYLAGDVIGLRSFANGTSAVGLNDARGNPSGITLDGLSEFDVTVVVAERPEDVRAWVEQVSPVLPAPLVMAVSYSAAPLAEPYVLSDADSGVGIEGLLVGYRDAYTYAELLSNITASRPPASAEPETLIPASDDGAETPDETPAEGETPVETSGDDTTATEGETPVETSGDDTTAAEALAPVVGIATVSTGTQINVRSGPGTSFAAIGVLQPGSQVDVIERAGDWTQVRLEDGDEGWVSTPLLTIEDLPAAEATPEAEAASKRLSAAVRRIYQQPDEPTDEPDADAEAAEETESDAEATVESDATASVSLDAPPAAGSGAAVIPGLTVPSSPGYRDERWYAMTLGIIVTVFIITIGSVVNVLRGLRRRRVS